uniref:Importin subunit alpha-like n=1 Tax=Dermatophagoides pteronyssinus TaxID=6956 RepID=A0A6P6YC05_DERPT|nr:importin subunit alpha-like [Dermatophagoides pteronyssinus]
MAFPNSAKILKLIIIFMDERRYGRQKDYKASKSDPNARRVEEQIRIRKTIRDAELTKKRNNVTELLNAGVLTPMYKLLQHEVITIVEQVVWFVGNVAGDCDKCRKLLINQGFPSAILQVLRNQLPISNNTLFIIRIIVWTLTNFTRSAKYLKPSDLNQWINILNEFLVSVDQEILSDSSWSTFYILDSFLSGEQNEIINIYIKSGLASKIIANLKTDPPNISLSACLRSLGTLLTGNDSQTDILLNLDCIEPLKNLLSSTKKEVRREACWAISNITAGSTKQIQLVIDKNVFPKLVEICYDSNFDIRKEAIWALSNACTSATKEQIAYLFEINVLKCFSKEINCLDSSLMNVVLDALIRIIAIGDKVKFDSNLPYNPFINAIDNAGILRQCEMIIYDRKHDRLTQKAEQLINHCNKRTNQQQMAFTDFNHNGFQGMPMQ